MPFLITDQSPFYISCDALVNPSDLFLSGVASFIDLCVHSKADPGLEKECQKYIPLLPGTAITTKSYLSNCETLIHVSTPKYTGEDSQIETLHTCYRNALNIAWQHGLTTIALPLLGNVDHGFPHELDFSIANTEIHRFLAANDEEVFIYLVIQDKDEFKPDKSLLSGFEDYYDQIKLARYLASFNSSQNSRVAPQKARPRQPDSSDSSTPKSKKDSKRSVKRNNRSSADGEKAEAPAGTSASNSTSGSFQPERGVTLEESFSQMVLRKVDEKGFKKDSELYHKANIDKRLFSRLRSDENYQPKKTTALALAVALELTLPETNELLRKAGLALSHSIVFDVIVEYGIIEHLSIFEINELLFQYDQALLGSQ